MRRVALTVALAAASLSPIAVADSPPAVVPVPGHEQVVPRAKFLRSVHVARHQRHLADRLRRQLGRERQRPSQGFTTRDTQIAAALVAYLGGWPERGALGVAACESTWRPYAVNDTELGGSNATGSWQVLWPGTWRSTSIGRRFGSQADAMNPYVNAAVAWQVWQRNGGTFREWADTCAARGGG